MRSLVNCFKCIYGNTAFIMSFADLKLILDLYKQMIVETDPPVNLATELRTLSGENVFGEQAPDKFQEGKEAELLKTEDCVEKATDIRHPMPSSSSE